MVDWVAVSDVAVRPVETVDPETEHVPQTGEPTAAHIVKTEPGENAAAKVLEARIMGTPLVADPFHQNRWDYYYQYGKGGKITEQRHIALFFSGDTLDRIEGTVD